MMKPEFNNLPDLWRRLAANFVFSLLIGGAYLFFAGSPLELFFAAAALVSNTFMLYAALACAGLALSLVRYGNAVFAVIITLFQLLLTADAVIYKVFKIHINSMVVNVVFTPGGLKSLDQGAWMQALFVAMAAAVVAVEVRIFSLPAMPPRAAGAFKKRVGVVLAVLMAFVLTDKLMFAWGSAYDVIQITRNVKLLPLYQPFTARTFIQEHFGTRLDKPVRFKLDLKSSRLDYPKKPLEFSRARRPNIIYIVIDSFRSDMMTPEVTPELFEFSKKAAVFKNHYSGGNCTRFGIFSLIYGLYGNYWFGVLGERRPPVLMTALAGLGYDFRIYAGTKLSFPEFDRTCFVDVPRENVYDEPSGEGKAGKDAEITARLTEFIKARDKKSPYFAFVFYDASHGSYEYPPDYERFSPAAASVNYLMINSKKVLPVFNKYKNSIYYDSRLAMRIVDAVRAAGELKDTAVIITGDHGEPFFEHGSMGHNQGYPPEEIKVPLIVSWPGLKPKVYESLTSHADVTPSVLKLLGVKNPPSDFSSGLDLFDSGPRDFVASFSWDTAAIIKKNGTLTMSLEAYRLDGIKAYDAEYRELKDKKAVAAFAAELAAFQREAGRFYRR